MSTTQELLHAFRSQGFAEIDISEELEPRLIPLARYFFAKPLRERMRTAAAGTGGIVGYYPSELEARSLNDEEPGIVPIFVGKRARHYSSYDCIGSERVCQSSELFSANVWPAGDDYFRKAVLTLYEDLCALMKDITKRLVVELRDTGKLVQFKEESFDRDCCSIMRLLDYPPSQVPTGSKPHTDYEFVSFIKASASGLEVRDAQGMWIEAPCRPGKAILLPGDMLEVATSGWIKSALHKVRLTTVGRLAVIFFQGLKLEEPIKYSSGGLDVASTFGAHLSSMLVRGAPHLQESIPFWEKRLGVSIPERNPFRSSKG